MAAVVSTMNTRCRTVAVIFPNQEQEHKSFLDFSSIFFFLGAFFSVLLDSEKSQ
jgi:hypothetical protein